ncbi:MAG TPA: sensor histidine kinase [Gaiellaceae bacterium]|jgi:signal transduction histidine kinase|nr:sensor histidine kinase [Gaiellaceae bacterium]
MQAVLERLRSRAFEALVLAFALGSVVEAFAAPHAHPHALVAVLALGWSLPFLWRPRHKFWAPLAVCADVALLALATSEQTVNALTMPFVALLVAAVSFGLVGERRLALAGWAALIGTAAVVDFQSSTPYADFFWTSLILSLAWFFGIALGTRTEQARELRARVEVAERERNIAAERAALDERARIARELHDVVAHSVSVMVVQASGVRRLLGADQDREREALLSVEQIGRQALAEMRRMLGVMRSGEEPVALAPQPGLDHIERLIQQVEEAGLPVKLRIEGERPAISPGVDLSAYRIVQEGLTNTLKHANGAHAEVVIRYVDDSVEVEIRDNGNGADGHDGLGHGLVGMRERVALYGGTLEAGPADGGGFVLKAHLPVEVPS